MTNNLSIRTVVSRLRASLHEVSADTNVSSRYLWNVFYTSYIMILNRFKDIYKLDVFTVDSFEPSLEDAECTDCQSCVIEVDAVEFKKGAVISYVGTPDLSVKFQKVKPRLFHLKKNNGFNYYYYENGKIHLSKCYPCIKVAYFSKSGKSTDSCSKLDNELNIPDFLINDAINLSLQEIGALNKPEDTVTNKSERS